MKWKLATATAGITAMLCAPTASATPEQDRQLYDVMYNAGLELLDGSGYAVAHEVCYRVWSGVDPDTVVYQMLPNNSDWTLDQAETFVVAAIVIYCPPEDPSAHKKMAV